MRLIHWSAADAEAKAERLRSAGHDVDHAVLDGQAGLSDLRRNPPEAFVIDLDKLPSHGRDLGVAIRRFLATRKVPLVFAGGESVKVEAARQFLPDATYTAWDEVDGALATAIDHPPSNPVVPKSPMEAYSGTPLPKKLGVKPGSIVVLAGAPEGFEETLGELPEGAMVTSDLEDAGDLTLWFVQSRGELQPGIAGMAARAECGSIWIIWPKKASGVKTDVTQQLVRETGLNAGLVDFKICAIDSTWSGLRFSKRRRSPTC